jgi:hypothetical protein
VNTRLSRVYGLAARQRVSLTLQGFDELTENEKDELFKKLYSIICLISRRAEAKGEEASYEDHLSISGSNLKHDMSFMGHHVR